MTAHIINPKLDPKVPATLSKATLQGILRQQLRYNKLIISDDMEMKAIADHFGADEAPRMAVEAGCDMICYRTEAAARFAYEALVKALENGKLSADRVLESAQRIRDFKEEWLPSYSPASVSDVGQKIGIPEHQELIQKIETEERGKK